MSGSAEQREREQTIFEGFSLEAGFLEALQPQPKRQCKRSLLRLLMWVVITAPPVQNGAYSRPNQPPPNSLVGGGPGRVVPGTAT